MSVRDDEGMKLTPGRLGYFLSIVAAFAVFWQVAGYAKTQELTNAAQDTYIAENKAQMKDVVSEMRRMNDQLSELVFIIKGASETQQSNSSSANKIQ